MPHYFLDMSHNPLLLTGLVAGALAGICCGVIGPYVVTRRIVFLCGAIAHIAVGGIGAAIFLRYHLPGLFAWLSPMYGAALAAVLAAVVIALVHDRVDERMDTLIGALWAVGMAVGIMLIKFTPGYHTELMSYLFGNLSTIGRQDVYLMLGLTSVILVTVGLTHKRLLAVCIDPQQARLQGIHVAGMNLLLLILVALTVICLIQVVGLILVIALLTLPAATAGHHAARMSGMIRLSLLLAVALTTLPRVAVYGTPISPEAAIVLAAAGVYLLSVVYRRVVDRRRSAATTN